MTLRARSLMTLSTLAVAAACTAGVSSSNDSDPPAGSAPSPSIAGRPDGGAPPPDGAPYADAAPPPSCGLGRCDPGAPCPDLVMDHAEFEGSIVISTQSFSPDDCAVVEGCILVPGVRRLLRFDTTTANVGSADLVLGSPEGGNNTCFQWSDCHMHYHFRDFAHYVLYKPDGVTVAAVGHKQAFCLEDVVEAPFIDPPAPTPATMFTCMNQGIHIGWEDVYPNDVPCQYIDITGVPPGQYVLSVTINAGKLIPELNYDNDEARTTVTIPP